MLDELYPIIPCIRVVHAVLKFPKLRKEFRTLIYQAYLLRIFIMYIYYAYLLRTVYLLRIFITYGIL